MAFTLDNSRQVVIYHLNTLIQSVAPAMGDVIQFRVLE
jgi:hypothetical protein